MTGHDKPVLLKYTYLYYGIYHAMQKLYALLNSLWNATYVYVCMMKFLLR